MKVRKAVIPAAGLGTRFLPATKALPKEMIPIVDKPAIQYIVEEIVQAGIEDILIITGRGKRAIEDHFDKSIEVTQSAEKKGDEALLEALEKIEKLADIHYLRQKETLGTGHAILKAKNHIGHEPFAVLYGDDIVESEVPCIGQLMALYDKYNCSMLGVQEVPDEKISSYGIVSGNYINEVFLMNDLVEKPSIEKAPSNLALLGRMILEPDIFEVLEAIPRSKRGELELTDGIMALAKAKAVYAYPIIGKWHTVGDPLSYLKTTVEMALKRKDIGADFKAFLIELSRGLIADPSQPSENKSGQHVKSAK
ncbi:MAG: UTP--glucose-1-phosphate uridylyltransferase GalU [Candidatus Latescibacterota bacterium]